MDDIDQTCSVPQRVVTQLICIYIGTTQQSPTRVFANLHPPVSSQRAKNWYRRPTWGMEVLGGHKHAWMGSYDYHFEMQVYFCRYVANNLQASDPVVQN